MNRSLILAGLFAAALSTSVLSTSAFAKANPLDQSPSPTVVYSDLVTFGGASVGDEAPNHDAQFETGSTR